MQGQAKPGPRAAASNAAELGDTVTASIAIVGDRVASNIPGRFRRKTISKTIAALRAKSGQVDRVLRATGAGEIKKEFTIIRQAEIRTDA